MKNPVKLAFGLARRLVDVVTPGSTDRNGNGSSGPAPVTVPPRLQDVSDRARAAVGQAAQATTGAVSTAATLVRERATGSDGSDGTETAATAPAAEAEVVDTPTADGEDQPGRGVAYEEWTKAQLYERAQELDVQGRSQMTKDELIEALREAR